LKNRVFILAWLVSGVEFPLQVSLAAFIPVGKGFFPFQKARRKAINVFKKEVLDHDTHCLFQIVYSNNTYDNSIDCYQFTCFCCCSRTARLG